MNVNRVCTVHLKQSKLQSFLFQMFGNANLPPTLHLIDGDGKIIVLTKTYGMRFVPSIWNKVNYSLFYFLFQTFWNISIYWWHHNLSFILLTHLLAKGEEARVKLLGWICVVFATSVFAAPLSIIVSILLDHNLQLSYLFLISHVTCY